jgi:hypothetical protein
MIMQLVAVEMLLGLRYALSRLQAAVACWQQAPRAQKDAQSTWPANLAWL